MSWTVEEVAMELIGRWDYRGDYSSEIEIRLGDAPDEIMAIDHAECYWREGKAKIAEMDELIKYSKYPNDPESTYSISIQFDTGVSVEGRLSSDLKWIIWDNGTEWHWIDLSEQSDELLD